MYHHYVCWCCCVFFHYVKFDLDFKEINVDLDENANEYIKTLQINQRRIPTIVFDDDSFLVEPSDVELENKLKELKYI